MDLSGVQDDADPQLPFSLAQAREAGVVLDQPGGDDLAFSSDLGVAAEPSFDLFPAPYLQARYVHLGSAPPRQQLAWLTFLREKGWRAQISVDMFEPFVATEPDACRFACELADLYNGRSHPPVPIIRKHRIVPGLARAGSFRGTGAGLCGRGGQPVGDRTRSGWPGCYR